MESKSRRQSLAIIALLVAVTFAVFGRSLFFDFVNWDDDRNIIANPLYKAPLSTASLDTYWRSAYQDQYMPVTWTTWAVLAQVSRTPSPQKRIGGEPTPFSPFAFHLLALGFHAINAAWVYLILRRILPRIVPATSGCGISVASLFGTLVWVLHPLQTEAAAWVNGGNITYAYFWGLAALYLYLRSGEWQDTNAFGAAKASQWAAGMLFLLALLSKPNTVSLVAIVLVLEGLVYRRSVRVFSARLAVWALLAVAVLGINWSFSRGSQNMADIAPPLYLRPVVAADAIVFCLQKIVVPTAFAPDHGRTPQHVLQTGAAYFSAIGIVLLVVILWKIARRLPHSSVPVMLLVAGLLPTLGFVPFYFQRYSTFADRYAYVALLALALIVSWVIAQNWNRHGKTVSLAFGGICLILARLSFAQSEVWRNNDSLFAQAVQVNPRSSAMWYNRANALLAESKVAEAEHDYQEAVRLSPGYVEAWTNLGGLLEKTGHHEEAFAAYQRALTYDAERPEANAAVGLFFAQAGNPAAAIPYWERALRRAPNDFETRFNLAVAYTQTKQMAKARVELETIAREHPELEVAKRLLRSLP